jgi:hypothetical protein
VNAPEGAFALQVMQQSPQQGALGQLQFALQGVSIQDGPGME